MANHPQALKRHKQSLTRRLRNRHYKTRIKGAVKALRAAIDSGAASDEIQSLYKSAESIIHRVAGKGIIPHNTAGRKVGRLAKAITRGPQTPVKKKTRKKK